MKIISRGELGHRLTLSCNRMECNHYRPETIWTRDQNSWPGDWEGRTILALVSLAKSTGKEPAYLEEIMNLIPEKINSLGYFGEIDEDGCISEQQLAGNSWFLISLIEYTVWKQDNRFINIINQIVENLYMPLLDAIKQYPTEKYDFKGGYSGTIVANENGWKLSTDIGCAFISLDGISRAYELLKTPKLLRLLRAVIDRYFMNDIIRLNYQTHATLSALRGVIRMCKLTGDKKYLELAIERFNTYLSFGMTENYENRNKFTHDKWTEPCGIVDSYMCCIELYKLTKQPKYIDIAHRIYYNAICHTQLPNGGFVLDSCTGYNPVTILKNISDDSGKPSEAFWCCTMRGADGLSYVSENQCITEENKYCFLQYSDAEIIDDDITIQEKSEFPYKGAVKLEIDNSSQKKIIISLYFPEYAKNAKLSFNDEEIPLRIEDGFAIVDFNDAYGKINFVFDIELEKREPISAELNDEYFSLNHGCLLLGTESNINSEIKKNNFVLTGNGVYKYGSNAIFAPINNTINYETEKLCLRNTSVLFKSSK